MMEIKRANPRTGKEFDCDICEDMGYTIIRCGSEVIGAIDCFHGKN